MKKLITMSILFCLISLNTLAETYYVTAKSLNIRSGAGSQNHVVGKLTQGQQVDVKNQKNGWSQVDDGWVASSFLSKKKYSLQNKLSQYNLVCDLNWKLINHNGDGVDTYYDTRNGISYNFSITQNSVKWGNYYRCDKDKKCKITITSEEISWEESQSVFGRTNGASIDRRTGILKGTLGHFIDDNSYHQGSFWQYTIIGDCIKREQIKRKF